MLRWPMEADTPKKALKRGPKFKERTASDVCRLHRNNLKQKFDDFSKNSYITATNVFKPWTCGERQNVACVAVFSVSSKREKARAKDAGREQKEERNFLSPLSPSGQDCYSG